MVFWATAIAVLVSIVTLAKENESAGTPDSVNNLATARNIASGKGFTSQIVHQYFVYQPVPNPETVRPPGIPYLLAICFRLFGVNLLVPVVLNGVFLLGTAICLRGGLRQLGGSVAADVAGMLAMLTACFEPISIWNNNALVFCTTLLFWVGALRLAGRISSRAFALLAGVVGAAGFLVKQSFLFTAVPAPLLLILFSPETPTARPLPGLVRLRHAALLVVTLIALSSPYWIRNLILFGTPIYNPMTAIRVVARYGGEEGYGVYPSGTWRTVRLGRPLSLSELVEVAGLRWVLQRELEVLRLGIAAILKFNPFVTGLALLSLLTLRRGRALPYLFVLLLMGEAIFGLFYISVSTRYLWSAYPCLLALVGLGIDHLVSFSRQMRRPWGHACFQGLVYVLLGLALWYGVREERRVIAEAYRRRNAVSDEVPWADAVSRKVPEEAVILTDNPWGVWWHSNRSSVLAPTSSREGLLQIVQLYRPTFYLYTNLYGGLGGSPPLYEEDLSTVDSGLEPSPWGLYRINDELFDVKLPDKIPDPPLLPR
jgi:Dolichyl-phosphate-mannose-protein mannosyltransferase